MNGVEERLNILTKRVDTLSNTLNKIIIGDLESPSTESPSTNSKDSKPLAGGLISSDSVLGRIIMKNRKDYEKKD